MNDIYKYNSDFDNTTIVNKVNEIAEALEEEENPEERFKLIYAQFVQGLKLSTWNNLI